DAGLAAVASPHYRSCGDLSWRPTDHLALDRGADPHDHLRGDPRTRQEGRAAPRPRRRQACRPGGDARLEHLAASRSLVRHRRRRRGLSHRQPAPVHRPDFLDHQSRQDRVMMTDLTFVPLLEKLADRLATIERYIVFTDAARMPATTLRNAVAYEEWI